MEKKNRRLRIKVKALYNIRVDILLLISLKIAERVVLRLNAKLIKLS